MDAAVLAYNFDGAELKKLKKLCSGKLARVRAVAPEDFSQPIGALCGVEKRVEPPPPAAPVDEQILVLAHFAPRQLDALLADLRTARVGTAALKAVLTPTNAKWNADRLCAELRRERDAFSEG